MTRRRVLVSACYCRPDAGSEAGTGWNQVTQSARFHDVWVFTRATNRPSIERALAAQPMPGVQWVYFDLPRWAAFWVTPHATMEYLYYCLWQLAAWPVARRLEREVGFDLVHHVTLGNYWLPIFAGLLSAPLLWGSVGGGEAGPRALWRTLGFKGRLSEHVRVLAQSLAGLNPVARLTARRAGLALVTTWETAERVRRWGACRVKVFCDLGLSEGDLAAMPHRPARPAREAAGPARFVSIGRLLAWKGFHFGLAAFADYAANHPGSEYWIIGDGPERRRLERLARKLRVSCAVRFWGRLPRAQTLAKMVECDTLVHPSLHDSGGWVCLEAMAVGLPVICLDLGGPALLVTEETGVKVPAGTPGQVVSGIAGAMARLGGDPGLRAGMAAAGQRRAREEFALERKGEWVNEQYEEVWRTATPPRG